MPTYEYTTQDVEYLRHGDRKFMARLFKPQGKGPFPAIIEVHGGAWCNGDLNECQIYAEGFARAGLAVMAIDFRHAEDGYPTSLADINYAIRWVKAHAAVILACWQRCGRTIRAMRQSSCRHRRRRSMRRCARWRCCGR